MPLQKRSVTNAVTAALGLSAAAATLVLTSSTVSPASAAPAAVPAAVAEAPLPVAPVAAPAAPAVKPVAHPAAHKVAVARHHAHKTVVRSTIAQAVRATAPVRKTTTTTTVKKTSTTAETAQPWGTNDYPYKSQTDFYAIDKWGFTERQCVSFAAWRLAQHGHTIHNDSNVWGSAFHWDDAARSLGRTVTKTAHVGAIAQWNAHESSAYYGKGSATANGTFTAGGYGHVGWVKKVYADGSALVEQYNMGDSRSYSVMRVKAPRYLLV